MAKYYGKVGYGVTEETSPGIYTPQITERLYSGDINSNLRSRLESTSNVNDNIIIAHTVSILADPFANDNFHAIKYVEVRGVKWKVTSVEIQHPRLILTTGGVYNGD